MTKDELLTVKQAADLTGYSPKAIRAAIESGKLKAGKLTPVRGLRILKSHLIEVLGGQ